MDLQIIQPFLFLFQDLKSENGMIDQNLQSIIILTKTTHID